MAAYLIADVEVTDPAAYDQYRQLVSSTVDAYGGKYLVRGGPFDKLEGGWTPNRLVVLEFESVERAKQWYESEEYKPVREIRHKAAISNVLIVEGA